MEYQKNNPLEKYGTASRTVTLGLGYWAQIAEIGETQSIDFKTAIKRAIASYHEQIMKSR